MIYDQMELDTLADDVKGFIQEHKLANEYIMSFSESVPGGMEIPGMDAVLRNHYLRDKLSCFLMYQSSNIPGEREKGISLADKIDAVDSGRVKKAQEPLVLLASELNDLLKGLDVFYYMEAGYVKAGDSQNDPIRRIYADISSTKKRDEIINYLSAAIDKMPENEQRIKTCLLYTS